MKPFKDQPLARKALTLGVVPTVCAILLVAVASMTATYITARRNLVVDLESQAAVIADNVSAALAFGDRGSGTATLGALRARANIDAVCVFDSSGILFAAYARPGHACNLALAAPTTGSAMLAAERPVSVGARRLGTVRIEGNLNLLYAWIRRQSLVLFGALIGSTLIAVALTRRLQRVISGPVLDLARTADAVSASRDYSIRAAKTTDDEVGGLARSFNAMLDEIQRQNEALIVEIAERKRAERLKDEFLAAVSHELRTPLNAILGWLQILRQTKPDQERMERALESLERNARSQARLIEDLLDVSRIVTGKLQMRTEVVDLVNVIAGAVEVLHQAAAAKSIQLDVVVPETPCLVSGDHDRLEQTVLNVLSNAVKFTPSGGSIGIELAACEGSPEFTVSVRDTGIGIAPAFLPSVFERFRQADGSMTRQHGGLGLGLAIVKEVTELHGGTVAAASGGIGQGATFTIRLPQLAGMQATSGTRGRLRLPRTVGSGILRGVSVLVVDDEPDALEIAATALADAGATVAGASSGSEAIERWQEGTFDVIVCDLALPNMDGFEVLERITEINRRTGNSVSAVALTAYASSEYQIRSLAAGFQAHVSKPYNTNDLVEAVADALKDQLTDDAHDERAGGG